MAESSLEKRVARLEAELAELRKDLKDKSNKSPALPWWERLYGAFEGAPYYKEATELGQKYRESLRPKAKKTRKNPKNGRT